MLYGLLPELILDSQPGYQATTLYVACQILESNNVIMDEKTIEMLNIHVSGIKAF